MEATRKAIIYGDSIMNGTVLDQVGNYISIMADSLLKFGERFGIEARNRSHYGMTIEQGQKVLMNDLEKGRCGDYALIEFGGNDCNFHWNEISERPEDTHLPRTSPELFEKIYRDMVERLQAAGTKPVLMTLPPIDSEKYLAFLARRGNDAKKILQWLGDVHMIYRFHELYSRAIERVARATDSALVDVRGYFLDKHNFTSLICEDGIHPNREGHKLLIRAFEDFAAAV